MADIKKQNRTEGLPDTGLRPLFADYARDYLKFQRTARDSGKKPRTIAREGHSLVHWIATIGNVRRSSGAVCDGPSASSTKLAATSRQGFAARGCHSINGRMPAESLPRMCQVRRCHLPKLISVARLTDAQSPSDAAAAATPSNLGGVRNARLD